MLKEPYIICTIKSQNIKSSFEKPIIMNRSKLLSYVGFTHSCSWFALAIPCAPRQTTYSRLLPSLITNELSIDGTSKHFWVARKAFLLRWQFLLLFNHRLLWECSKATFISEWLHNFNIKKAKEHWHRKLQIVRPVATLLKYSLFSLGIERAEKI